MLGLMGKSVADSLPPDFTESVLRELFAAAALSGLLASGKTNGNTGDVSEAAYAYAATMLEERKRYLDRPAKLTDVKERK